MYQIRQWYRPLLVTRPVSEEVEVDRSGYLSDCEWLDADADAIDDIVAEVERVHADAVARARLGSWSARYFDDTSPGATTARF